VSGRRSPRTRYRPDPWGLLEWIVVASGFTALATMALARTLNVAGVSVSFFPLAVPALPLLPVAGILVAAAPVLVVPAPRAAGARVDSRVEAVAA